MQTLSGRCSGREADRWLLRSALLVLAALPLASAGARAAPLYTYDFTPAGLTDQVGLKADNPAAGLVNVTPTAAVSNVNATVTNVTALNWGTVVNPGFENQVLHVTGDPNNLSSQGAFLIHLTLTDQGLVQAAKAKNGGTLNGVNKDTYSRVLTFKGTLNGSWGVSTDANGNRINPFSDFPSANPLTNPVQKVTNLGGWDYHIDLSNYVAPPNPLNLTPGGIGGFIKVTKHKGTTPPPPPPPGPGVETTPEPSTMLLSCLGLSLVGAASWRKRRRAAPAAA